MQSHLHSRDQRRGIDHEEIRSACKDYVKSQVKSHLEELQRWHILADYQRPYTTSSTDLVS